ncbi:Spy/CpxP family protein refolding chaperone [Mucilaginibacter boryungensis]|uniref:Spy/CpxP family protein refolding chaperone n=1 Tax=Mucilaginibacter boryungensis TaxID=768480 RepID=A0ABR9XJU2_9SPHI|nr:Spy/CpxP family protein refolding chaperone [Mucilaginibacter boryungensis]MBE9667652.1 Spy/CpxP family protein refolding chaperone [Mucilaginibacter boryungensis]
MKKLMLVCCFVIGATVATFAQGGGMRRSPEEQAKALQTQLKLTDDQTAKITAIYATQAAKRDSMMKAGADRSAMRPLMQASNEKIQAILTDEQKDAYKKMMAERMSRMGGQGGGGGTPPPPPSK